MLSEMLVINRKIAQLNQRMERVERALGLVGIMSGAGKRAGESASDVVIDGGVKAESAVGEGVAGETLGTGEQRTVPPPLPMWARGPSVEKAQTQEAVDAQGLAHAHESAEMKERSVAGLVGLEDVAERERRVTSGKSWWTGGSWSGNTIEGGGQLSGVSETGGEEVEVRGSRTSQSLNLESLIGGRWFAAVGAVVVVIGIAMFIALGVDRGWFSMSPQMRCVLGAVFGLSMLGIGEVARRKVGAMAAVGAFAAGLGTLYVTIFAAYGILDLFGEEVAFGLMAMVALVGVGIGVVSRLSVVSVLSLVTGYVVPVLYWMEMKQDAMVPLYLLMLMVVGLGLTAWNGPRFAGVRTVTRLGTMLLGGVWMLGNGWSASPWVGIVFVVLVWCGFHGELWVSAVRQKFAGSGEENTTAPPVVGGVSSGAGGGALTWSTARAGWNRWAPIMATLSVGAWAGVLGVLWARGTNLMPDWMIPAGFMAASGGMGLMLAGTMRYFTELPRNAREELGATCLVQSSVMLIVTVALVLGGWAQVTAWLAMAIGAGVAGRMVGSRVFSVYAMVVLGICTLRLIVIDFGNPVLWAGTLTFGEVKFSIWGLLMALCSAVYMFNGWLMFSPARVEREDVEVVQKPSSKMRWERGAQLCWAIGWLVLGWSLMYPDIAGTTMTVIHAMVALGMAVHAALVKRKWLMFFASMLQMFLISLAIVSDWWTKSSHEGVTRQVGEALGMTLAGRALVPFAAGVTGCVIAVLIRRRMFEVRANLREAWAGMMGVPATLFLLASAWHVDTPIDRVMWAWVVIAGAMWGIARVVTSADLRRGAAIAVFACGAVYLVLAIDDKTSGSGWSWWYTALAVSICVLASLVWKWYSAVISELMGKVVVEGDDEARGAFEREREAVIERCMLACNIMIGVIGVVWFSGSSKQVASTAGEVAGSTLVMAASVSIWWGVMALGLIGGGFWKQIQYLRWVGLGLLAIAAVKGLLLDIASSSAGARITAFIVLGLLMIGVAFVYQRLEKRLVERDMKEE